MKRALYAFGSVLFLFAGCAHTPNLLMQLERGKGNPGKREIIAALVENNYAIVDSSDTIVSTSYQHGNWAYMKFRWRVVIYAPCSSNVVFVKTPAEIKLDYGNNNIKWYPVDWMREGPVNRILHPIRVSLRKRGISCATEECAPTCQFPSFAASAVTDSSAATPTQIAEKGTTENRQSSAFKFSVPTNSLSCGILNIGSWIGAYLGDRLDLTLVQYERRAWKYGAFVLNDFQQFGKRISLTGRAPDTTWYAGGLGAGYCTFAPLSGTFALYANTGMNVAFLSVALNDGAAKERCVIYLPHIDVGAASRMRRGPALTAGVDFGYCIPNRDILNNEFSIGRKGGKTLWRGTLNVGWGW
jgi:hypothetical protein